MVFNSVIAWYRRVFSDPHAVGLIGFILVIFILLRFLGGMLAPVLASIVIAYLLEGVVQQLTQWHMPRIAAVLVVFLAFLLIFVVIVLGMAPLLSGQVGALLNSLPRMLQRLLNESNHFFIWASEWFPYLFKEPGNRQITVPFAFQAGSVVDAGMTGVMLNGSLNPELLAQSQAALSELMQYVTKGFGDTMGSLLSFFSFRSLIRVTTWIVYLVLTPILVFFFMKDKEKILRWFAFFVPKDRRLVNQVWQELNIQIGNYIRGKVLEIIIMCALSFVTLVFLDVRFAFLLSVLIGFSVLIPYVGATVVTFPLFVVGFAQFGWERELFWVMLSYGVIQLIDANVLVPLIFSEVVDLHPIAIIVAILIFGGLWGFWGVFFAIPLATLVQAIFRAWPKGDDYPQPIRDPDYSI